MAEFVDWLERSKAQYGREYGLTEDTHWAWVHNLKTIVCGIGHVYVCVYTLYGKLLSYYIGIAALV